MEDDKRFRHLNSNQTGIDFKNILQPTSELNIFNYLYFYDGGGVAAGDLTGNGLPDLYFTSNQSENKLYINDGNFQFRDVTAEAFDIDSDYWSTGVTFADLNNDGLLDIYVSNVGGHLNFKGRNQLFINQGLNENGIPQFIEKAEEYGLDLQGLSTQAVFFDYDLDGDLDMYMLNHSVHSLGTFTYSAFRQESNEIAGDRLLRNDDGTFTEVTEKAGIYNSALGYGLGIGITDFNQDGFPDIYIGNDFHEDDYLYMNNGDGTFTESLEEMIQHTSYSSMGNDLVDFNNDGLMDIISLDMLPEDYEELKASVAEDPLEIYNTKLSYGYKHKFTRNTLQLNRGGGKFSEIAMLAGVYATDWSWAALGADFNHNGYTDLYITNGIYGRTNNMDYISFITQDEIQQRIEGNLTEEDVALAEKAPAVKIANYMYSNNGSLLFDDVSENWGLDQPGFSSGAVYTDLDDDGDLDLVVNNVNDEAFVYRNMTREEYNRSSYLKIKLNGPVMNPFGIGTQVKAVRPGTEEVIVRELYPVRGFQSSVEPVIHMGFDSLRVIPELNVRWPDGKVDTLWDVKTNQTITVHYNDAESPDENYEDSGYRSISLFEEITEQLLVAYKHEENDFIEFNREPLIPHMVSREGPAIAVGDVNGDGLEDFYAGGAKRQEASLYLQNPDHTFDKKETLSFEEDFIYEDVDAELIDFTGNGYLDLIVVSGGNEYSGSSEYMMPRLYINDGDGNFTKDTERLPELFLTGSVSAIDDVNLDGLPDIFIGARAIPWKYGERPVSYLLMNNGEGYFEVDSTDFGQRFSDVGLVTGAEWADMDGDGIPDLVIASEWESLKVIYGDPDKEPAEISNSSGLWNAISITDLDSDGRLDIIAGNLGLNSKFKASEKQPLRMYVNDFDDNGIIEQIITYIDNSGEERLFATRDELAEQLPYIGTQFETYHSFAEADLFDIIDQTLLDESLIYTVNELQSSVFFNRKDGFKKSALPITVQFSPVHTILELDLDGNTSPDLITAGNFFDANIQRGRYDAGYGNVLLTDENGDITELPNHKMDWFHEGQIRKLDVIKIGEFPVLMVSKNDESIRFYKINIMNSAE